MYTDWSALTLNYCMLVSSLKFHHFFKNLNNKKKLNVHKEILGNYLSLEKRKWCIADIH